VLSTSLLLLLNLLLLLLQVCCTLADVLVGLRPDAYFASCTLPAVDFTAAAAAAVATGLLRAG
jgi:hypothetical protein